MSPLNITLNLAGPLLKGWSEKYLGLEVSSLASKVCFTHQNLLDRGDPMELNFEFLKCKNQKY